MRTYRGVLGGVPWIGYAVESRDDIQAFIEWVHRNRHEIAYDTETTGLDIFGRDFRVRVAQFGTTREAWAIPIDADPTYYGYIVAKALEHIESLTMHNAPFDWLASDQDKNIPIKLESLWAKTTDTRVLSHLRDSRGRPEGGTGHGLKDLANAFVDQYASTGEEALKEAFKEIGTTKRTGGFAKIDLWHTDYIMYACLDVILTSRVRKVLTAKVPSTARGLVPMENELAFIGAYMQRTGFLMDVPYTEKLSADYVYRYNDACDRAETLGVENINSTMQVIKVLTQDGAVKPPPEWVDTLTEEQREDFGLSGKALAARGAIQLGATKTGLPRLDAKSLEALVSKGNPLAKAVQEGKRALKWDKAYASAFLEMRDENDRIHANINTLLARTARWSVTSPALLTLPSSEFAIRECLIADDGEAVGGIDYANMELRVAAALSGDPTMMHAFAEDLNLHQLTAEAAFGQQAPGPDGKHPKYKLGKMTNFLSCFGGAEKALMEQAGVDYRTAKHILGSFWAAYPKFKKYADKQTATAKRQGYIVTASGRVLHTDANRPFAATNYSIQSFARDLMGLGAIKVHRAGMLDVMRLIVHDEFVISAPKAEARDAAHEVGRLMSCEWNGVNIPTEPEVYGRSWGDGYKSK
ncbi:MULTISPECIES: DNA polymerase [Streptomyces]